MIEKPLLTTIQAAKIIGWAPSTLAKSRLSGEGPSFVKLGASVRYRLGDLEDWVEERVRQSTSQPFAA